MGELALSWHICQHQEPNQKNFRNKFVNFAGPIGWWHALALPPFKSATGDDVNSLIMNVHMQIQYG